MGVRPHIDVGVITVPYNISESELVEVLGHEIADHALHGSTLEKVRSLRKALYDKQDTGLLNIFHGSPKVYTEDDMEFVEDSIEEFENRDALFKPIPIDEFEKWAKYDC